MIKFSDKNIKDIKCGSKNVIKVLYNDKVMWQRFNYTDINWEFYNGGFGQLKSPKGAYIKEAYIEPDKNISIELWLINTYIHNYTQTEVHGIRFKLVTFGGIAISTFRLIFFEGDIICSNVVFDFSEIKFEVVVKLPESTTYYFKDLEYVIYNDSNLGKKSLSEWKEQFRSNKSIKFIRRES